MTFNIFASFAEFERELIHERTLAGLEPARLRGRIGGRRKGLILEVKKTAYACYQLCQDKSRTIHDILQIVNISRVTFLPVYCIGENGEDDANKMEISSCYYSFNKLCYL